MASLKTIDKLDEALFVVDDILVSPEIAAAMFGIKKRYFNRLVAANSFGLQEFRCEYEQLGGYWYYREDIDRISHVYKSQKKSKHVK